MHKKDKTRLKALIEERITDLQQQSDHSAKTRATVALDQQSVGRLSRMDAMQQQAMANATESRRQAELTGLRATLLRLNDEEFGYCEDCGDAIALKRIELNPKTRTCIACQS